MAAITDLATLAHTDLLASDWLVVHDLSAATDKKMAPFVTGTWTPALNFGGATTGITYTTQSGNYVRMGNLVYVHFSIVLSSKGSATGAATITGLPFAGGGVAPGMSIRYYSNLASIAGSPFGWIGTTTINLVQMGAATPSALTNANFANNSRLDMWGVYYV